MAAPRNANGVRDPFVVDTNVLIAANGTDVEWRNIASECINRLNGVKDRGRVCVDSLGLILGEYGKKLPSRSRTGFGDMFYLWIARNRTNAQLCEQVVITPHEALDQGFEECPVLDPEIAKFIDPSDRKFLAVAHAHAEKPPILQATDCKWIGWKDGLAQAGLTIDFVDEDFLRPIYLRKMQ
jgi:hypothetical protein